MHKIKNKKIIAILLNSLIAISTVNLNIYADDKVNLKDYNTKLMQKESDSENNNDNENSDELEPISIEIKEIYNSENLGKTVKIEGTIESIENNIINIKDEESDASIYLKEIEINNLTENNIIIAIGKIELINDNIYLVIYRVKDIQKQESVEGDEDDKTEDDKTEDNNNIGDDKPIEDSKEENKNNNSQNTGTKPNIDNDKVVNMENVSIEQQNNNVITTKKIYARNYINISYNLSESQWNEVKAALENEYIKVVDLPNNKIRIKKVANKYGDKVWIVNDPRLLDKEEMAYTIGLDIIENISREAYDISEYKWNIIIENVKNGSAKIKSDKDNLKVIYNKKGKSDSTIIIKKI